MLISWVGLALLIINAVVVLAIKHTFYNITEKLWDKEYKQGVWNYLADSGIERTRTSTIFFGFINIHRSRAKSILDVGCGEGILFDYLPPAFRRLYTGIDLSLEAIKIANSKRGQTMKGQHFIHSSALAFSPPAGVKYDVIVFNEMLYYVNHVELMKQYSEYLAEGGIILVSVYYTPDFNNAVRETIFTDAHKLFDVVDEYKVSGYTIQGNKKMPVSFQIEGLKPKKIQLP